MQLEVLALRTVLEHMWHAGQRSRRDEVVGRVGHAEVQHRHQRLLVDVLRRERCADRVVGTADALDAF